MAALTWQVDSGGGWAGPAASAVEGRSLPRAPSARPPRSCAPGAFSSLGSHALSIKQVVTAGWVGNCKSQRSLAFLEGGAAAAQPVTAPASPASAFARPTAAVPPAAAPAALAASEGGLSVPAAAEGSPKPPGWRVRKAGD